MMTCRSGFSPTLLRARIVGLKPELQLTYKGLFDDGSGFSLTLYSL
jgi:hypothetical protein